MSEVTVHARVASPGLRVAGNELRTAAGEAVWLQGLSVDGLQLTPAGEHTVETIGVAIDRWHANAIRLAVQENFWFGTGKGQTDGGRGYREVVDAAVAAAAARGAYLALDLHRFGAPLAVHAEFWTDAAARYANHPAVLFELFNEAHTISWATWRDGGDLRDASARRTDANLAENTERIAGTDSIGMQALVDAARATGARNVVIAGGLDWGYDLTGVMEGYALDDRGGDGIVYSSHIYPWKKDWVANTLVAARAHPVFIGEVGCPRAWDDFAFITPDHRYEELGPGCAWPTDMLGWIQQHRLHWTGFSFHPHCGPMIISDWQYTPTPYWGVYVRDALAGTTYEVKRVR